MSKLLKSLNLSLIIGAFVSFLSPGAVFADTYGSGSYGDCTYNTGCTTTPATNPLVSTVATAVSSAGSAITTFFCSDEAPTSAPNLYQIDVTSKTAKLYFAPAAGPYNKHFVSFGQGNNSEGNGAEFSTSNAQGALTYEVTQLSPSTIYTFKVRGGNGCKPGSWSSTLTIKTQGKNVKKIAKFYPNKQAKYLPAKPVSWATKAKRFFSSLVPSTQR